MTQILISGHGHFASGMLSAAALIVGQSAEVRAIDFNDGPERLKRDMTETLKGLSNGQGIIVFTDLLGATPFQTAVVASREITEKVLVVGGANLSMILAAAINRDKPVEETLNLALNEGKQFIDYYRANNRQDSIDQEQTEEEGI
ncbi:hypothetical protein EWI07_01645 [Sporolactobacillus sp. THM7-4]|nr:hypothetical protein EWI07_01645 [Sporolactobacillus sp. THM7-4]